MVRNVFINQWSTINLDVSVSGSILVVTPYSVLPDDYHFSMIFVR
jgi:hypothetical protein